MAIKGCQWNKEYEVFMEQDEQQRNTDFTALRTRLSDPAGGGLRLCPEQERGHIISLYRSVSSQQLAVVEIILEKLASTRRS